MTSGVMNGCRAVCVASTIVAALVTTIEGQSGDGGPNGVVAAMLRWRIGIERAQPPNDMVETITPVTIDGRRAWRVTHYPFEPDQGSYDFYDVDAATFSPIRSVMKNPKFDLSLTFEASRVLLQRTENANTVTESIPIDDQLKPEGPGHTVFMAGLPLKPGYTLKYRIVDRFGGKERGRVKEVTISVSERRRVSTAMGEREIVEVTSTAADGSFGIIEQVRADPPHFPYRMEYRRSKVPLISDVTTMAIDSSGGSGSRP